MKGEMGTTWSVVRYFVHSVPTVSSSERDILQVTFRVVDLPLKTFIELGTIFLCVLLALELPADRRRQDRPHGHAARGIAGHSRLPCGPLCYSSVPDSSAGGLSHGLRRWSTCCH